MRLGSWMFLCCGLLGCDGSSTSGERITLRPRIELEGTTATSRSGWSVELTRAEIAVGALHFFNGEPLTAESRWRRTGVKLAWRTFAAELDELFSVRTAHAHPGHYVEGDALGEMLAPQTVDLLAGSATLGAANAVSGLYRSARFTFASPPTGVLAASMQGASIVLEGNAAREGEVRRFRFRAEGSQLQNASGKPELEGCPFEERAIDESGDVLATIAPSVWFLAADFAELPVSDAPLDVPSDSKLFRQIREQVLAAASVRFRYQPQ